MLGGKLLGISVGRGLGVHKGFLSHPTVGVALFAQKKGIPSGQLSSSSEEQAVVIDQVISRESTYCFGTKAY